jgi:hypothetical protein
LQVTVFEDMLEEAASLRARAADLLSSPRVENLIAARVAEPVSPKLLPDAELASMGLCWNEKNETNAAAMVQCLRHVKGETFMEAIIAEASALAAAGGGDLS